MLDTNAYKKVLNSLSAHIAILDEQGNVVETNRAWRVFGESNGLQSCSTWNYLQICDQAALHPDDDSSRVAEGIRRVMRKEIEEFLMQYPCHSPEEKRWFAIRVVPFCDNNECRVIISHENITPIVEVQKALEEKEEELVRKKEKLEETNIALRVLLDQRNEDRKQTELNVFTNIDRLVSPYLAKLETTRLSDKQKTLVEILKQNLEEVVSPFLQRLSSLEVRLTPQEIEVAHLIRSGHSSKEIADIMYLSVAGVDFHRKNIRKKFGLTNSRQNLRTYLMAMPS